MKDILFESLRSLYVLQVSGCFIRNINGKTDNNRFILFSILVTNRNMAALPPLLSPQFSHRSPISKGELRGKRRSKGG